MVKGERLEIITKSEAARRWKVSPAMVTKYIDKGMPVRADGRLDWPEVDRHRSLYNSPERSGNARFRREHNEGPAAAERSHSAGAAEPRGSEFSRGAAWIASELCSSARRTWPAFVSELDLPGIQAEYQPAFRGVVSALMLHLVETWLESYVDSANLAPIDWSSYGEAAASVEQEATELMNEWRASVVREV